jgi:DNA-binding MarR family transcriptional regulator
LTTLAGASVTAPSAPLDFSASYAETPEPIARPRLSTRQKHVLALVMESGSAGPSLVSRELGVGISTAYRDLASLEELDLITSDGGKRRLTAEGMTYLDDLTSGS